MTKISLTFYDKLLNDLNGASAPIRGGYKAGQMLTAAGAATAAPTGAKFVRVSTDTAMTLDVYAAGTQNVLLPANAVDDFPVVAGQIITFVGA